MDRSRLPMALLVALGLAPEGCTTGKEEVSTSACLKVQVEPCLDQPPAHPCLSPPVEVHPCLSETPEIPVGACLKVGACLDVKVPETKNGPCLSIEEPPDEPVVRPCLKVLRPTKPRGGGKGKGKGKPKEPPVGPCLSPPKGGNRDPLVDVCLEVSPRDDESQSTAGPSARNDVIERLLGENVLPPDVAKKLRS